MGQVGSPCATATTPEGSYIVYTRQEWEAFTNGVRAGEFDFHK